MTSSLKTAFCPECHSDVPLPAEPEMNMRFVCPECGTALEIVNDSPWELDYDSTEMDDDEEMYLDDFASEEDEDDFPDEELP